MALALTSKIMIGTLVFNSVHEVEITSGYKELSDRCTIILPTRGVVRKDVNTKRPIRLEDHIKTGQKVTVELGYNGSLKTEFVGYVSEIQPGVTLKLYCEDEMYTLKRTKLITKSYSKITLKALLKELLPTIKVSAKMPNVSIENFKIGNATKAYVLQELADKYGLAIYFRDGELHAGLPYDEYINNGTRYVIFKNVIEDNLKYIKKEDVRLKVRAVSKLPNNKRVEVEVGDADGEERTLNYYNISSLSDLKQLAEADLKRYKFEGYRGSITTFGIPKVTHSESVEVSDPRYIERTGRYVIESVKTTFGQQGFRREIELAIKVG